ncbi:MAG TPA: hypothetical protein VH351_15065 [Bryobacteraceae bacterium]|jgi:hypothetical protein|nr:hypothetical protein [Bryobacteraceae bacterium]
MQSFDHSLAAYFGDGPADSSVLRIFHRVLAAVDAIYAAGKSHPPLSPQTIRLDDSKQPHIPCFNRAHQTTDTVAFGSVKYSAPEAFLHNGDSSFGEAADCYVLGFIFYEILIGKRLFLAQFAALENGPPSLWLKWHADKTVKVRPLTELRPNLGHFARLIDGMMEKDSSKRSKSISQVLDAFSTVEAQTTYHGDTVARPASGPKLRFDLVRNRATSAAAWLATRFSKFRKLYLGAGVLLAIAITVFAALLVHREIHSLSVGQRTPKSKPSAAPPLPAQQKPSAIAAAKTESAPSVPAQRELSLQIEPHLPSGALLLLDDLQPLVLAQNRVFTQKVTPGSHKVRFVTRSKASLSFRFNIGEGDISFVELPKAQSLRYVLLASNANSAKVYATPETRAGLSGQGYEAVPEGGLVIANNQVVTVSLGQDSKAQIHLDPLPPGSIRVVVEPGAAALLVPVEISANVPDADIVINGKKLTHKLQNGVRAVRLPVGEYHVKLIRPEYQDSREEDLVLSGNEQRRQLQFTLVPIVSPSKLAVSAVPEHGSALGAGPNGDRQAIQQFGKITFHLRPDAGQISCRREDDSQVQDCANNQACLLRTGAYEITAKADGFKTEVKHIAIGAGDDKPYEWKLEAVQSAALNPLNFFENGHAWTVDSTGWWTKSEPGYSFMRAHQGIFVLEVLKHTGIFASKKVSLVVNYKNDANRVLYTIDEHKIRRNERAPGIEMADYLIAYEIAPKANYRFTLELSTDRVTIRDAEGKILDNLARTNAVTGKVGFSGKLKLRVIQAKYSQ